MEAEAILYLKQPINEVFDPRTVGKKIPAGAAITGRGGRPDQPDWRVWNSTGFGNRLQSQLANLGKGYSAEVTDMGKCIAVRVSYHNPVTGKGVAKTYVVYFDTPDTGDGRIFVTSTKWRTISSFDQAASYIRSSISSYAGQTSNL